MAIQLFTCKMEKIGMKYIIVQDEINVIIVLNLSLCTFLL